MIPVKILEMVARKVGSEYGHDTSVIIQIYDDNGNLKEADYALDCFTNDNGTLFLTNKKVEEKPKRESFESKLNKQFEMHKRIMGYGKFKEYKYQKGDTE